MLRLPGFYEEVRIEEERKADAESRVQAWEEIKLANAEHQGIAGAARRRTGRNKLIGWLVLTAACLVFSLGFSGALEHGFNGRHYHSACLLVGVVESVVMSTVIWGVGLIFVGLFRTAERVIA